MTVTLNSIPTAQGDVTITTASAATTTTTTTSQAAAGVRDEFVETNCV